MAQGPLQTLVGLTDALSPAPQVTNVDDEGVELGSGVMELTQSELVLHLHRRQAVRWPYLCLRRYGYDSNLFSFESGRRCQTGQGESQPLPHTRIEPVHLGQVLVLEVIAWDHEKSGASVGVAQRRVGSWPRAHGMLVQN